MSTSQTPGSSSPSEPLRGIVAGEHGPGAGLPIPSAAELSEMAIGAALDEAAAATGPIGKTALQAYQMASAGTYGKPAARLGDLTEHGSPLTPGPGSFNVIIGFLPAWRGIPNPGQSAPFVSKATALSVAVAAATAAAKAAVASGDPAAAALEAAQEALMEAAKKELEAEAARLGIADQHYCPKPAPKPPHGTGMVVDGTPTVLINYLPACRMGDSVMEPLGWLDKIATGWPTVLIGGGGGDAEKRFGKYPPGMPTPKAHSKADDRVERLTAEPTALGTPSGEVNPDSNGESTDGLEEPGGMCEAPEVEDPGPISLAPPLPESQFPPACDAAGSGGLLDDLANDLQEVSDLSRGGEVVAGAAFGPEELQKAKAWADAGGFTPAGKSVNIKDEAQQFANQYGGTPGETNALQHAYWQAAIAQDYSDKIAKEIGDKHESWQLWGDDCRIRDSLADQHNNGQGRSIGSSTTSREEMEKQIIDAMKNGHLDTGGGVGGLGVGPGPGEGKPFKEG